MPNRDYRYNPDSHPFQPDATGYHKNNGLCLAAASNLAYEPGTVVESVVPTWRFPDVQFVDAGKDTQAFVAANGDTLLIVFRGTENIKDWMTNVLIKPTEGPAGKVHRGFYKAASDALNQHIRDIVETMRTNEQRIWIAGHSLGGALALLTAAILQLDDDKPLPVQGVYTFGQPRVGNRTFATAFDQRFNERAYRLVNNNDIVPHVPPVGLVLRYWHTQKMIYIDEAGDLKPAMPFWKRMWEGVQGIVGDLGNPGPDALNDHSMDNYVAAVRKYAGNGQTGTA